MVDIFDEIALIGVRGGVGICFCPASNVAGVVVDIGEKTDLNFGQPSDSEPGRELRQSSHLLIDLSITLWKLAKLYLSTTSSPHPNPLEILMPTKLLFDAGIEVVELQFIPGSVIKRNPTRFYLPTADLALLDRSSVT